METKDKVNEKDKEFIAEFIGINANHVKNEHLDEKSKEYVERENKITGIISTYAEYLSNKCQLNIKLKKNFFWISFITIWAILVGILIIGIITTIKSVDSWQGITIMISSLIGIVTSVLVLPKIIGEYLFPCQEDEAFLDLIKNINENDKR